MNSPELILSSKYRKDIVELVIKRLSFECNSVPKILVITYADDKKEIEEVYHISNYDSNRTSMILDQISDDFSAAFTSNVEIISTWDVLPNKECILDCDLIIILGGHAPTCIKKLYETELVNPMRKFKGLVWGISAGAKVLCDKFVAMTNDGKVSEYDGLGLLNNFSLLVHRDNGRQDVYNRYYSGASRISKCIGIKNNGVVIVKDNIVSFMENSMYIDF